MNRLTPLIVRHAGAPLQLDWIAQLEAEEPRYFEDLKLFATGWLGGLVFFGTFLA